MTLIRMILFEQWEQKPVIVAYERMEGKELEILITNNSSKEFCC